MDWIWWSKIKNKNKNMISIVLWHFSWALNFYWITFSFLLSFCLALFFSSFKIGTNHRRSSSSKRSEAECYQSAFLRTGRWKWHKRKWWQCQSKQNKNTYQKYKLALYCSNCTQINQSINQFNFIPCQFSFLNSMIFTCSVFFSFLFLRTIN